VGHLTHSEPARLERRRACSRHPSRRHAAGRARTALQLRAFLRVQRRDLNDQPRPPPAPLAHDGNAIAGCVGRATANSNSLDGPIQLEEAGIQKMGSTGDVSRRRDFDVRSSRGAGRVARTSSCCPARLRHRLLLRTSAVARRAAPRHSARLPGPAGAARRQQQSAVQRMASCLKRKEVVPRALVLRPLLRHANHAGGVAGWHRPGAFSVSRTGTCGGR
jgi:hypothetical protein